MNIILFLLFSFILLILSLFSFKKLSPIPYFPTQKTDINLVIKALNLKNNQIIFDLGAGDGLVIFEAAKKAYQKNFDTKFIAVEINPVLISIMIIKRFFHPNKKNIKIIYNDIFKIKLKNYHQYFQKLKFQVSYCIFYLYISPWSIKKVFINLKKQLKNFKIVSYMYPIPFLKPKKLFKGKNQIFLYHI